MDALVSRAEEGRGKTAISLGQPSNRRSRGSPNEATHPIEDRGSRAIEKQTQGTETSQYLEEEKIN